MADLPFPTGYLLKTPGFGMSFLKQRIGDEEDPAKYRRDFQRPIQVEHRKLKALDVQIIIIFPRFSEEIFYLEKNLEEYTNLSGYV